MVKLKPTSQVELSHLLISETHCPCLKALRDKIRGFLICLRETHGIFVSALKSRTSTRGEIADFMCVFKSPVCVYAFHLGGHSFIYAS